MGLASVGSAISESFRAADTNTFLNNLGGIIYPITFHKLIPLVGFGWATRTITLIMVIFSAILALGLKMRTQPAIVRRLFDAQPWTEPSYVFFALAVFLGYRGFMCRISTSSCTV